MERKSKQTGQGTGGFHYLIVHCSLFSLKKAGGAQESSISFFYGHPFSNAEVENSYRKTNQQENEGVTNRKEGKALESKPW